MELVDRQQIVYPFEPTVAIDKNKEARLSYADLHAVASQAGYLCRSVGNDEDDQGIDAVLTAYRTFPGSTRTQITINIQLKATI